LDVYRGIAILRAAKRIKDIAMETAKTLAVWVRFENFQIGR
jgi:hypothetical protein